MSESLRGTPGRMAGSTGFQLVGFDDLGVSDDVPETEATFVGNAVLKARAAYIDAQLTRIAAAGERGEDEDLGLFLA